MENQLSKKELILNDLAGKSVIKQVVYDHTAEVFVMLKSILQQLESDYNKALGDVDNRVSLVYKDNGPLDAELKIAGDVIVFSMHTNVFDFDRDHNIRKISYVKDNPLSSYCGVINIYNFLSDSFKYNRMEDLGYLIGRIFINKDKYYFVEGKRQLGFLYNDFGKLVINENSLREIIETSVKYALEFDLLVPPYDNVKIISVGLVHRKISDSKISTGKRLGFRFNSDDV